MQQIVMENQLSSVHVNFMRKEEVSPYLSSGYQLRETIQYRLLKKNNYLDNFYGIITDYYYYDYYYYYHYYYSISIVIIITITVIISMMMMIMIIIRIIIIIIIIINVIVVLLSSYSLLLLFISFPMFLMYHLMSNSS